MRVFNIFSFLFVLALISNSNGGITRFINMLCVELNASLYISDPHETPKAAMRACIEFSSCIGVKKIAENGYQLLNTLTGYVINETCKDYYLWDLSGGKTFPNQPTQLEPPILYAIYKFGECPVPFNVDGTLCRGYFITKEWCYSYSSYMVPQWDGTTCSVVQKQAILNSWA